MLADFQLETMGSLVEPTRQTSWLIDHLYNQSDFLHSYGLPCWELTYPIPKVFLKMIFRTSSGGICDRFLEGMTVWVLNSHLSGRRNLWSFTVSLENCLWMFILLMAAIINWTPDMRTVCVYRYIHICIFALCLYISMYAIWLGIYICSSYKYVYTYSMFS